MNDFARASIRQMEGYVPGEQPTPGKFIKLNTNENPYPPSSAVIRAIQQAVETSLIRYPDPHATAFRHAAAQQLNVDPDWILCGNGSDDILTICARTFVGEGQRLRFPKPSYTLYRTLANIQGAVLDEVRLNNDWSFPESFTTNVGGVRLAIVANPNSPSGTRVCSERLLEIADALPCPLVIDEAYAEFADDDCMKLVSQSNKILVTRSMSKSYALAGLRFGYVVAQPNLIQQLAKVKDSYNCDALAIAGATAAINDQAWLRKTKTQITTTRSGMEQQLCDLGFRVQASQANFVWCTQPAWELEPIFQSLKRSQILVRYMNYDGWGEGLRISVGTKEQTDACLSALAKLVPSQD